MTDDPRALAKKVLSSPDSNPLGRDCARALLAALDHKEKYRKLLHECQENLVDALDRAEAAERGMQEVWGIAADAAEAAAERDRYREALEYVASDPRLPNRLKRIITDALSPARSSKAKSQLCECGHHRSTHPYVGRHASWPTRCVYCDCTQFRSSTAEEKR